MTIYEHRAITTIASGSANTTSLNIRGGLLRQLLITALTSSTTTFRADLTDKQQVIRGRWGYHTGEINDTSIKLAMAGSYRISITNASATDTFRVTMAIQED